MAYIYNQPIYKNGQIISYYSGIDTNYAAQAAALGGTTSPTSAGSSSGSSTSNTSTQAQGGNQSTTSASGGGSGGQVKLYWGGSSGNQAFLAGSSQPLTSITLGNGQQVFVGPDGTYYDHGGNVLSASQIAGATAGKPPISVDLGAGSNSGGASSQSGPSAIQYDPSWSQYGISQGAWSQMDATQQSMVGAILDASKALYSTTTSSVSLDDALKAAATDPNIVAKYADAYNLDTQAFTQNLQTLQQTIGASAQEQSIQFQQERANLAKTSADAGQAYSGFRNLAQSQMAQNESAVIQSTNAENQARLQDLVSSYEAKYGSAKTNAASLSYIDPISGQPLSASGLYTGGSPTSTNLTANPLGGITGSEAINKQNDINALAGQYVQAGEIPNVIKP